MNVMTASGLVASIVLASLGCLPALGVARAAASAECGVPVAGSDGWQVATQESAGLDPKLLCELVEKLTESPQHNVHGVVVVRGGRLVFEDYQTGSDERWGTPLGPTAHGPDVKHDVRSVSKSVTSLLVGIALDRKLLASVDEPVFAFFPEYSSLRSPDKDRILVRHLLAMTSGITWDEYQPYTDPRNSEIRMIFAADPYRFVLEQPIANEPDEQWNYSGGSTQLLAAIVQKATESKLDLFARDVLFGPLGITDFEWVYMPSGEIAAASGLRLRPRDMAKIGQLILNEGQWGGQQIVSSAWLREALELRTAEYGYQWWIGLSVVDQQVIEHAAAIGNGGQRIYIVPALDLVVIVTAGLYNDRQADSVTTDILDTYVLSGIGAVATSVPP